jgi:pSer/pThr/pTyr-binding forkhead associated (FHA) protein
MPSLTIITGDYAGKQFVLANRPLSIGRDPTRDIQIIDSKVSRKHAMVRADGDNHVLTPAKALNGVTINDVDISEEAVLSDGDRILLGDTELMYADADNPNLSNAVHQRKLADRDMRDKNTLM